MNAEELIERIKQVIREEMYPDIEDDDGTFSFEIYCDYRDQLSDSSIGEITAAEDPEEALDDMLNEWASDYTMDFGRCDLESQIRKALSDEELAVWNEHENEIDDWFFENVFFYYPKDHFNQKVCVNILLDTGDASTDFVENNALNYWGGYSGELGKTSSIRWLAKQQGKLQKVLKAVRETANGYPDGEYAERKKEPDAFVESVVQELENMTNAMSTLTFLVEMPLFDLLTIKKAVNKRSEGSITLGKDTMCGLFNQWNGGGSVLEIELCKDVKIPLDLIWDIRADGQIKYGYDVCSVYAMCRSAWRDTLKDITIKEAAAA